MLRQTVPLGRVAGIRVGAHWSALAMVALVGSILGGEVVPSAVPHESVLACSVAGLLGALAFIAGLLAHELAHALVAHRHGIAVPSITLWALGGVSELGGRPSSARAEFRIAVAGPATSVVAGLVFGGLAVAMKAAHGPYTATVVLSWLAAINLLLAVFNLLPGIPLDGGRILRALLWRRYGDRVRAVQVAAKAGRVVGALLLAGGVLEIVLRANLGGLWLILIGLFVMSAATAEATAEVAATALGGVRVHEVMTPDPDIGATWMSLADFVEHVALRSDQRTFPVVGPDLSLAGIVATSRLNRIPQHLWADTPLDRVLTAVPPAYLADPYAPAADLLVRPPLAGDLAAIVLDQGRIVGIVSSERLNQAVRRETLRSPSS